jgi:hypothetical protein
MYSMAITVAELAQFPFDPENPEVRYVVVAPPHGGNGLSSRMAKELSEYPGPLFATTSEPRMWTWLSHTSLGFPPALFAAQLLHGLAQPHVGMPPERELHRIIDLSLAALDFDPARDQRRKARGCRVFRLWEVIRPCGHHADSDNTQERTKQEHFCPNLHAFTDDW